MLTTVQIIYGWDLDALRTAVQGCIKATGYQGDIQVYYQHLGTQVLVRPNNFISWARSSTFMSVLLYGTLLYPFGSIWEQRWDVCGAAYAFKRWEHLEDSRPGQSPDDYMWHRKSKEKIDKTKLRSTELGVSIFRGLKEGEWFSAWEDGIARACKARWKSNIPLTAESLVNLNPAAVRLDGYPVVKN